MARMYRMYVFLNIVFYFRTNSKSSLNWREVFNAFMSKVFYVKHMKWNATIANH